MLLPSALACESRPPLRHSQPFNPVPNPQPASSTTSSRQSPRASPAPPGGGWERTCRALQALLGSPVRPSTPSLSRRPHPARPERLQSPAAISCQTLRPTKVTKAASKLRPPPRGVNKRRRDVESIEPQDQEMRDRDRDGDEPRTKRSRFCTPERPRRVPSMIPLGLSLSDFEALQSPPLEERQHAASPRPTLSQSRSLYPDPIEGEGEPIPTIEPHDSLPAASSPPKDQQRPWNFSDSTILVDIELQKLQLGRRGRSTDRRHKMGLRCRTKALERSWIDR